MPTMLRHKVTGEVWPYNPNLARHHDVEKFDQPDPQFAQAAASGATLGDLQKPAPAKPAPVAKKKPAPVKAKPAPVVEEPKKAEEEDPLADLDLDDA